MRKNKVPHRTDLTDDDERRMGTFFYKIAAIAAGLLVLFVLAVWFLVRLIV